MHSILSRAPARRAACSDLLDRQLGRYCPRHQGAVRALAMRHARLADLALSFPALLFALAVPRRDLDPARAIGLAVGGSSLAEAATAAGVALWLRKLPPEAFVDRLARLPDGPSFRCRIANHLPARRHAAHWLQAVSRTAGLADDSVTIWIARETARDPRSVKLDYLRLVSLWAWFSNRQGTFGHGMIRKRWTADVRFVPAVDAAHDWRRVIELHVNLGQGPIADLWLRPAHVYGFDFKPLASASEIVDEAAAMNNCLRNYGKDVAHNFARLWSMRMNGQRVATLEVAFGSSDPLPRVVQLKGPANAEMPVEVWWAAHQWVNMHGAFQVNPKRRKWGSVPLDRATWIALWRPYWLIRRRIPGWLPVSPSRHALRTL